ncbi:MAG: hypothetical protein Q8J68_03885 [Methanolobus sp.]|uniref:hypothetical protein n=1 Tax=Methanolobus sp. TaxID=1874737 RepID=UPI002731F1D4|nr:hypothetical protein [Methanolobus sp.]MDP2216412.1 hypothetical protein [Methanolobus sp.]
MVIIEGTAFPLDTLNKNGWGVPASEADSAISSLKNAVIRVCPRDSPHGCDYSEDPKAEIGRVLDAWKENDRIRARAEITDPVASQKISEGTWPKKWSVYSKAAALKNGWAHGVTNRSLTLVTNPAWDESTWEIAASDDGQIGIRFFEQFSIVASVDDTMTENNTPPTGGVSPAELDKQIADKQKEIDDLKASNGTLTEQITTLTTEVEGLKTVAASKDAELSRRITMEEAQKLIASAIAADKEVRDREAVLEKLTAARKELSLETRPEDYKNLTAADLEKMVDEFGKIKLSAAAPVKYPSASGSGTVGRWDSKKGEWVV